MISKMRVLSVVSLLYVIPYCIFVLIVSHRKNKKMDKEALFEDKYEREVRHDFVLTHHFTIIIFVITWLPYAALEFTSLWYEERCACLEKGSFGVNILKVLTLNTIAISAFLGAVVKL